MNFNREFADLVLESVRDEWTQLFDVDLQVILDEYFGDVCTTFDTFTEVISGNTIC